MQNYPKQKEPSESNIDKWADCIRLLRTYDKKGEFEIEKVLRWSQMDYFWRQNVRSGKKFREQYDALFIKMMSNIDKPIPKKYDGEKIRND